MHLLLAEKILIDRFQEDRLLADRLLSARVLSNPLLADQLLTDQLLEYQLLNSQLLVDRELINTTQTSLFPKKQYDPLFKNIDFYFFKKIKLKTSIIFNKLTYFYIKSYPKLFLKISPK